ncbi:transposase family protein [Streptomyces sp. NPDC059650]|uniref:transposase family protein n=1 Tax=Streptomyces sp. NPDC059650 TaxID=3346896 RepID=UPI003691294D
MVFVGDELFWDLVWPDVEGLVIDAVGVVGDAVWIDLHARQPTVTCPSCGVTASRVHSTYMRRLAERPLGGRRVLLRLRIRRFFCDNGLCSRRTMAEQVSSLTTVQAPNHGACPDGAGDRAGRRRPGRCPARRLPACGRAGT